MRLAAEFPVAVLARLLGVSRSSCYVRARRRDAEALRAAIRQVVEAWQTTHALTGPEEELAQKELI